MKKNEEIEKAIEEKVKEIKDLTADNLAEEGLRVLLKAKECGSLRIDHFLLIGIGYLLFAIYKKI